MYDDFSFDILEINDILMFRNGAAVHENNIEGILKFELNWIIQFILNSLLSRLFYSLISLLRRQHCP